MYFVIESAEKMIASAVRVNKGQSNSCDEILENVESEFAGLAVKV